MSDAHRDLATDVFGVAHLEGEFLLRSGVTAIEYFDKYQFEARPDLLARIVEQMAALVPEGTEVLAGLELGGVPVVTALSLATGIPAAFVRKAPKEYGTRRLVEGADVAGRRVVVVEDVVTSGGQVVMSTKELRARSADVQTVLCVIDREAGGAEAFEGLGVDLRALFTAADAPTRRG